MTRIVRMSALGALMAGSAGLAWAEPDYTAVELAEGFLVTPSLMVEERYDDNIFQTENDEEDSLISIFTPGILAEVVGERSRIGLSYAGEFGVYHQSSDDNYDDHLLRADYDFESTRAYANINGFYEREHDNRGEGPSNGFGGLTTLVFDEPTEYDSLGFGATGGFKLDGERFRVEVGYDRYDKEYDNLRTITRDRDRENESFRFGVYRKVMARTEILLEGKRTDIDYDNVPASGIRLSSTENRILAGVAWQATAKTRGAVKIGSVEKDFDDGQRNDRSNVSWEVDVTWEPRTYSRVNFSTFRGPRETDGQGDAIDVSRVGVRWDHQFSDRTRARVGLAYVEEDYEGASRDDDMWRFNIGMEHDIRRWLSADVGYRFSTRDSSQTAADFDRNVVFLSIRAGL